MTDHHSHHHVAAVFTSRDAAEAAVADLRRHGLGDPQLGMAIHGPGRYVFEDAEEPEMVRDTETGVEVGVPIGILAGMTIAALAVPGVGPVGVGGIIAIGLSAGLGGGMLGGYLGIGAASEEWEQHERLRDTALGPGEILLAACAQDEPDTVTSIMQKCGGRILETT